MIAGILYAIASLFYNVETQTEINCLALNVYHEARGETVEGQIAVAQVTMNRVKNDYWPDSVCKTVFQKNQFSWTEANNYTPTDQYSWATAEAIASGIYYGYISDDYVRDSVFYHTVSSSPSWSNSSSLQKFSTIENHVFYTWKGYW